MKRLCVAVLVTMSSMALAQEIGTEITPVTPGSGNTTKPANQPNDNPYANNPPANTGDKQGEVKPAAKPVSSDGILSAQKGAFGVRATFGGQGIGLAGRGTAAAPVDTGSLGFSYWGSDQFTLLFDVGVGLGEAAEQRRALAAERLVDPVLPRVLGHGDAKLLRHGAEP